MSGVMMMIIAIVVLGGAYLLYGRYLQNKWGIDPNAKTPAYEMEDGVDYVPVSYTHLPPHVPSAEIPPGVPCWRRI